MGIIDSVKKLRHNERHGGLGEPNPGVHAFAYRDCKSQHIKRYCEKAEESGFLVDLASAPESRYYERLLEKAGFGVDRSWHVLVWSPGEERPDLPSQLVETGRLRPDQLEAQIAPRNVSQLPGSPDS